MLGLYDYDNASYEECMEDLNETLTSIYGSFDGYYYYDSYDDLDTLEREGIRIQNKGIRIQNIAQRLKRIGGGTMIAYVIKNKDKDKYLSNKPYIFTNQLSKARFYLTKNNVDKEIYRFPGCKVVAVEIKEIEDET